MVNLKVYQQIAAASKTGGIPLWKNFWAVKRAFMEAVSGMDRTQGCVAVSDTDILVLKKYLQLGTPVEILP